MKTYEVTIKATIIKTFTIKAESREAAIEQANETFHVGHEFDVPEHSLPPCPLWQSLKKSLQ